ncbi:MAG TPA: type II secretion system minor pseudopilin GspI [Burkholderiaceae bacterium]
MSARMTRRSRGFTLVEVLVALGIVSVALLSGVQASSALTRNAQRQSDALLAQLCVENELVKVRLAQQLPGVGQSAFTCTQAERVFDGRLIVATTPNPSFLRVDAQVFDGEYSLLRISTVVGRF